MPTKFPSEELIAERLLASPAVLSELFEHFLLPARLKVVERSTPFAEVRPAYHRQDESGQFTQEMVIGRRTE